MEFRKGSCWEAGYDSERNICTAVISGWGMDIYEISREIYDSLEDGMGDEAKKLIRKGRHLYKEVIDPCGPPYTVVFDKDYQKLCPWSGASSAGPELPPVIVDAMVDVLESEKDNREQRRKKRGQETK